MEGGGCLDTESKGYINPLEFYYHYSHHACKIECLTKLIIKNCSCIPYHRQGNDQFKYIGQGSIKDWKHQDYIVIYINNV